MNTDNESPPLSTIEPLRFESPYRGEEGLERLHVFIGRSDVTFIRLLRPQMGTFTTVMANLWKALCAELRDRNILDNTSCNEFESFVSNIKLITQDEYQTLKRLASGSGSASPSAGSNTTAAAGTKSKRRSTPRPVANPNGSDVGGGAETVRGVHPTEQKK